MARVRKIEPGKQDVQVHPTEVDAYVQSAVAKDGTVYFHLSTFGSANRISKPKSSQSIQLDSVRAAELIEEIYKVFPHLK